MLPLASFLLLLLTAGVRRAMFRGDDKPSLVPAYVATGAMALAFVFSFVGAVKFSSDLHKREELETQIHVVEKDSTLNRKQKEERAHPLEAQLDSLNEHWRGTADFANIRGGILPDLPVTMLRLGFLIDSLSVVMYLMVTFIGTLIHVYSIGYMGDELFPIVEDHHVHTEEGHLRRRGRFGRFFLYLSLFCFSMLNLVLADNLFQISRELGAGGNLLVPADRLYYERQRFNAANKALSPTASATPAS